MNYNYYHMCSDGTFSKHFITCEEEHRIAFNLTGVCAANIDVDVLAFSDEESHPHKLLGGTYENCLRYKSLFESTYKKAIIWSRGSLDGLQLDCSMYRITDLNYLMNVGTYIVNQPTKDGKKVMPYDYLWGTGSMYFRPSNITPIWQLKENGTLYDIVEYGSLSSRQKQEIVHSRMEIPSNWKICNGLILPQNYVKVEKFEEIYRTHNCFRTFLSSGRGKEEAVTLRMAEEFGITMEDLEAKEICRAVTKELSGAGDIRLVSLDVRLKIALELRNRHHLSRRQIATLVRLPISEVEKYV